MQVVQWLVNAVSTVSTVSSIVIDCFFPKFEIIIAISLNAISKMKVPQRSVQCNRYALLRINVKLKKGGKKGLASSLMAVYVLKPAARW